MRSFVVLFSIIAFSNSTFAGLCDGSGIVESSSTSIKNGKFQTCSAQGFICFTAEASLKYGHVPFRLIFLPHGADGNFVVISLPLAGRNGGQGFYRYDSEKKKNRLVALNEDGSPNVDLFLDCSDHFKIKTAE